MDMNWEMKRSTSGIRKEGSRGNPLYICPNRYGLAFLGVLMN
jgi:hypothetical protein